jgi:transposase-like protein
MSNEIKQAVVDARLNKQWTYSMIFEEYGIPKSTAQGWCQKFLNSVDDEIPDNVQGHVNENLQRDKPTKFKKTEDEVLEFLSQLAPITVTGDRTVNTSNLTNYAVVGSDFHFGCHDEDCISIFLETVNQLKPSTIILNGDTMDMLAISKYPKDIAKHWSLLDERKSYHKFLDDLISVSGGATIYETYSNHSGQSIDGRWRRYLSDRLGELGSLPEIVKTLSYENVFMGEYQKFVKHVDFVELNSLVVTHGTTVRSKGGASCIGEVEKWGTSIMHGHTHRMGSSVRRVPAVGNRTEKQLYGFEGGALCSLNSVYAQFPNWQQGFNIVSLDDNGIDFGVEQVMINSGRANVSTLGITIKG